MGLEHLQTVYSYGGGEALYSVFSAVASFFENYGGSVLKGLAMFGLLWAGFKSAANRDHYRFYIKWFLSYMVVMIVLWQPGSTGMSMHIRDVITKETFNVQGLPPGLVVPAGLISGIGHGMTKAFESVFTSVSDLSYQKYGTVFGAQVASELRNFKIQDPVFRENMESYVSNCMAYDVMIGQSYDITTLKTSPDVFKLIKDKASRFRMVDYRRPNAGGRDLITCYQAIVKLEGEFTKEHALLGLKFPNFSRIAYNLEQGWLGPRGSKVAEPWRDQAGTMFVSALQTALGFYGNTESGQQALRQILMINAFKDKPASYGSMRALQNQNTAWHFTGELARTVLPVMHATFEALVYGCFPIIIGFLFFTGAFRLLGSYFGILIWLQLWPLLFSILNLVISVFSRRAGLGEELTINNITNIVDTQSSYAMAASSLGMLVPVLSYMIVRGGAGQFVHIASQLAGASSQGVATATAEVTSGNRSYDNVSMGNTSLDNANSHKHDITLNSRMMTASHQNPDGSIETQRLYGDHKNIIQSGKGLDQSTFLGSVNISKDMQQSAQKSYSEQEQHFEQETAEFSQSVNSTEGRGVSFIANLAENMNRGETYNFDTSTSEGQAFTETLNRARDFLKNHNYGTQQEKMAALSAMLGVNAGAQAGAGTGIVGGSVGVNGKASVDLRGSASNTGSQELNDKVSSGENDSLNQNIENLHRATKNMTFGDNQSRAKDLRDSFNQSYDETQSKRHSLTESQQKMEALQKVKNYTESLTANQNIDVSPAFYNFLQTKENPDTGRNYTPIEAKDIINGTSKEDLAKKDSYLVPFINEYMPRNLIPKELPKVDLKKTYRDYNFEAEEKMEAFKARHLSEHFKKTQDAGSFEKTHEDAKAAYNNMQNKADTKIEEGRMRNESTRDVLKGQVKTKEGEKNPLLKVLGIGEDNKNEELWNKGKK